MNRKLFFLIAPIFSVVSVLMLSSFFNPQENPTDCDDPEPTPKIKYRGQSKKSSKNGLIRMSSGFQNDYFTNNKNEGFYYIEIEADKFRNNRYKRPAMNLSVVIDRSGSMSGEKIRNAKKAAKHIVDNLNQGDFLSIIIYDQNVTTLHHQASVRNKESIKRKIDGIQDRGSTNLMGGAMQGYEEVNEYYKSGYINRVLLLSDGLANEGITDPGRIKRIVQGKFREENIAISTFGVGNDYNEDLMTAMAENGNGNYYFIEKPTEIAGIFRKELNGLMEVVAQNSTLTINVPNTVKVSKVYGYSHTQRGNKVSIKLNDIFSKETKGILVKYKINQGNMPNSLSFTSSLNYRLASTERNNTIALRNFQKFTNSPTVYNESFSEWVDAQVVLNEANYKMEMAMQAIDKGDYTKGRKLVKETTKYFNDNSSLVETSEELQRAFRGNATYDTEIKDIETRSESEKKYIQKSNKSMNYKIRRKK
jgi:Ca-activated chloride channel family protein